MSQFDEKLEVFKKDLDEKLGISYDEALLTKVAKGLGPSLYNKDSGTVSSSDQSELDRVKTNFLIKKLGLSENDDLDGAIQEVVEQMGVSNKNKHRAIFYYLLVKKFGKESVYN